MPTAFAAPVSNVIVDWQPWACAMRSIRQSAKREPPSAWGRRACRLRTARNGAISPKRPGSIPMNATRSSASTSSARRTSTGTVICPVLLGVSVDMSLPLSPCFSARQGACQDQPSEGSDLLLSAPLVG